MIAKVLRRIGGLLYTVEDIILLKADAGKHFGDWSGPAHKLFSHYGVAE
jgi:hypothetical protein